LRRTSVKQAKNLSAEDRALLKRLRAYSDAAGKKPTPAALKTDHWREKTAQPIGMLPNGRLNIVTPGDDD
jgi:hypothetical protein